MAEHPNAPRCQHVHVNGLRCGSPAMRNQKLCYYHKQTTGPRPHPKSDLPNLEDGDAIQLAIAHVVRQIKQGSIEYRAAHLMIDAYRLALRNLKNMRTEPCNYEDLTTVDPNLEPDISDFGSANPDYQNASSANSPESHITEPITHEQEQEMMEAGTLPQRAAVVHIDDLSSRADKNNENDASTALSSRAEHVSAESRDHALDFDSVPQRGTTNTKPIKELSEKEQGEREASAGRREPSARAKSLADGDLEPDEAEIMRLSKNKAYFMKEEDMPKGPPPPDFDDIMAEIRKELRKGLVG